VELPDLHAARRFLEQGDEFLLTSHVNSDGDGIGSCLALRRFLQRLGKKAAIIFHDEPDRHYDFLDDWETIQQVAAPLPHRPDYAVVIDCSSLERVGDVGNCIGDATRILNIDHHEDNQRFGAANLVSPEVSSSSEMIYHLAAEMDLEIDTSTAAQLYAGILFDTGGFRYSLTTATTFEVAAALARCGIRLDHISDRVFGNRSLAEIKQLGRAIDSLTLHFDGRVAFLHLSYQEMQAGDPENAVNYGLLVESAEVAALFKEEKPGEYRISLRSRGRTDVRRIAARFGGGGHTQASGCRLKGNRGKVERDLLDVTGKHLNQGG
jgi:phosphoesterase RecJ-like protein